MSAISIIRRVRDSGGDIAFSDDSIKLKLPASLHDELVSEIKAQKDAIKRALKSETDTDWDFGDYRAFYEERAAIREHDGGMSREETESKALEDCVTEWLFQNPEPSEPGRCAWCGDPEKDSMSVIPFGTRTHGHTWLHAECWQSRADDRRSQARTALSDFGVETASKLSDDYPSDNC